MMVKVNRENNVFIIDVPRVFRFVIIIFLILHTPFQPTLVSADSSYLFHPGFGKPTIDGIVETSEWANADTYTQVMVNSTLTGTLYVLQDNSNLYLGFVIDDDELTTNYWYGLLGDTLDLFFDDDNSGSLYEVNENIIVMDPVTQYYDKYFTNASGNHEEDINQPGGQTDGEGQVSRPGNHNHFELSFPLCSGDIYDFCLSPGNILGLQIKYYDIDSNTAMPSPSPSTSFLPGNEATELVTIEIQDFSNSVFLPLIYR